MVRGLGVFVFGLLWASLVSACPDYQLSGAERLSLTGRQMWRPQVFRLRAGGERNVIRCGFGVWGYLRRAPDYVFDMTRLDRYARLHVRINADCDPIILLRDGRGRWFFDDDSGTGQTASLSIADPVNGTYHVWAGTYGPQPCDGRLTLETF